MVATASKRRLSSTTKIMKKPLATSNFKPKIVVKESDRIARMKAAREAYSKLSKDRSQKPSTSGVRTAPKKVVDEVNVETKENKQRCHDSPARRSTLARDFVFKPVKESLDMIRNGGFRMPATGRYSSIGGIRSSKPRPSLLPLGINVFDSKVSASDKEKVRDFLSARCNAAVTPSKMAASPLTSDNTAGPYSLRSSRSVRFRMEAAIEEQRESDGDAVLQLESTVKSEGVGFQRGNTNTFKSPFAPSSILKSRNLKAVVDQEPSTSSMLASYGIRTPADTSRKEVTPEREHHPFLAKARRALLQSPLPSDISTDADFGGNKNGCVNSRCVPNFDQCCYTHLFNMSEEDWSKVEPIMVNQLADLLQERRERINEQANIRDTDMSESLASLPDDILPCEPKKTGFRRIDRRQKQNSSVDLQANQEIVLINESARNGGSACRLSRLRLKDPVSRIIGGDSPFAPIRDSPL